MNAITPVDADTAEPTEVVEAPATAPSESANLISMIERAVLNPAVDIDKMERLLAMKERIEAKVAETAFNTALAEMGPKLPIVEEHGEIKNNAGKVQSTYAKWEDINEAIKPVMAAHGFALRFRSGLNPEGRPSVTGILSHCDGHSDETTIVLPVDSSGSKNSVQAIGSSTSYGQRYTAKLLLNLTSRGLDDDGKSAGVSEAAQRFVSDINACDDLAELRAWKAKHYDAASKLLGGDDLREVISLYNRRVKAAREREEGGSK